ncbi:hypothetical protein NPIL_400261 [Nephila pilipes]|uniref:Uncharacterized protein n=1 Tax=Nephila pilipes TaxID=299642 RepID=A0A8X6PBR9_NEPPI|nr:hypothetical protein NPIL_567421 [Nephila pilipes]GFT56561.1 hypothetical protein NPIL_400261 [Nephila pilipes]
MEIFPKSIAELESFANHLFSACLRQYGLMAHPVFDSPFNCPSITKAVISLQYQMRDSLRKCFHFCIDVAENVTTEQMGMEKIAQLLTTMQSYSNGDIFNSTLFDIALMIELILYMRHMDLNFPFCYFVQTWVFFFKHNKELELEKEGGWKKLEEVASTRYTQTEIYQDLSEDVDILEYPYQAFSTSMDYRKTRDRSIQVAPIRISPITDDDISFRVMRTISNRNPILARPHIRNAQRPEEQLQHQQEEQERQLEERERLRQEQERLRREMERQAREAEVLERQQAEQIQLPEQQGEQELEDRWC